ncbi:MAG: SMP-30/gluconolactonase/LRE family protein [Rhodoferax sp.]
MSTEVTASGSEAERFFPAPERCGQTPWTRPQSVWSAGASLGEGALWSEAEQALYWVDIHGHQLHRYTPQSQRRETWDTPDIVTALSLVQGRRALMLSVRHGVALFDPDSGALRSVDQAGQEPVGNRFNDAKVDRQGRLWCCSMDDGCELPSGALYRWDAGHGFTRHVQGLCVGNGPTWSLDGRTLYLSDSVRGTVRAYAFDTERGTLGAARDWLVLPPQDGLPDGLTTDAQGRIWVAHWGGRCVTAHDPDSGETLQRIDLPASQITSCAFGGADYQTLFITSARGGLPAEQLEREPLAGALFAVEMPAPGLPPTPLRWPQSP